MEEDGQYNKLNTTLPLPKANNDVRVLSSEEEDKAILKLKPMVAVLQEEEENFEMKALKSQNYGVYGRWRCNGYKFNIFYPHLLDNTKSPTYMIEKDDNNGKLAPFIFVQERLTKT
ncbi:hypothetical protein RIF29_20086 [Crotalaria pallida]|uniref:Splicing factor Cactin C-terminal domain-containing protein n=1 Tax=Crotalaria pallida TaxID=3830 RepID=A0AAN9I612_CROPI